MNNENPQPVMNTDNDLSPEDNAPIINNDDSNNRHSSNPEAPDSENGISKKLVKVIRTVFPDLCIVALIAVLAWFVYVWNEGCYRAYSNKDVTVLNDSLSISPAAHWPYKGYRLFRNDNRIILFNEIDDYTLTTGDMFLCLYFGDEIRLVNCETNKVLPGKYKYVDALEDSLIAVCTLDDMLSFIDENGKVIIKDVCRWPTDLEDCDYSEIPRFEDGFCLINTLNGTGLLDKKGKWRIPPGEYWISDRIDGNNWIVFNDSGAGVYNADSTRLLVPCEYDDVKSDENTGLLVANTNADRTFLNKGQYYGDIVIENITSLGKGIYRYESSGVYGLFSECNGIITPPVYRAISQIGNKIACFAQDQDAVQWFNQEGELLEM